MAAPAGPAATPAGAPQEPEKLDATVEDALKGLEGAEAGKALRTALTNLKSWFDRLPVGRSLEAVYHEFAVALEDLQKLQGSGVAEPALAAAKAGGEAVYNRWAHEAFAPDLSSIGSKVKDPNWLADWILEPRRHDPKTVMPRFRLEGDPDGEQKRSEEHTSELQSQR